MSPCYVTQHLEAGADEEDVAWSAISLFTGGADTTVSSIVTFFLAMCLYPQVQKRAQQEIDRVIGTGRMPRISDAPKLPYVRAVIKETMRWHPVLPLSEYGGAINC